ncbi:RNA-directed DNA polymerase from mobile element jockey [Eumeta japonica]|uniref:RNA-directed DNA polymerase from mobile element jockey n=1 Tax=Eumeta variegata TaxID=151549 RepID=A0A4C1VL04_EUMVA|nr:RNA-directed DNA polymerase from mobile element jockey [Eumeta japonica]
MTGHGVLILVSVYLPPKKKLLRSDIEAPFALEDDVILFGDLNSKITNWKCNYSNSNGREMVALAEDLHFNIITLLTPTHYLNDVNRRPDILDIALMKGVALKLSCVEPLKCINSNHRPVLMRLGSPSWDCPPAVKTMTNWQKVSTVLEEIDTPILNSIPNDIVSTDDIGNVIGTLTNHIRTVVDDSSRTVSANSVRKELPRNVKKTDKGKKRCFAPSEQIPYM